MKTTRVDILLMMAAIVLAGVVVFLVANRGGKRDPDRPRVLAVYPDGAAILEGGRVTEPGYADPKEVGKEVD